MPPKKKAVAAAKPTPAKKAAAKKTAAKPTAVRPQPRIKTEGTEPVVVVGGYRMDPKEVVKPNEPVQPLRERDIPQRLRTAEPVAVTVAYKLARGNWDRVRVDGHGHVNRPLSARAAQRVGG